jgi:hypothetical protein
LGEIASDGSVSRGAISYALGSNGGYTLKDETVKKCSFKIFHNKIIKNF